MIHLMNLRMNWHTGGGLGIEYDFGLHDCLIRHRLIYV